MKELTLEEAALAWAHGKRVEAARINDIGWLPVDPIGESRNEHWGPMVFGSKGYRFRLAPEPPAKKFRAFTGKEWEAQVGRPVVYRETGATVAVGKVLPSGLVVPIDYTPFTPEEMLIAFTFRDGSPCGVEVEA